jgi:hypothetical protein
VFADLVDLLIGERAAADREIVKLAAVVGEQGLGRRQGLARLIAAGPLLPTQPEPMLQLATKAKSCGNCCSCC